MPELPSPHLVSKEPLIVSDWGWVVFGYSVLYGTLGAYVAWMAYRLQQARRRLGELQ